MANTRCWTLACDWDAELRESKRKGQSGTHMGYIKAQLSEVCHIGNLRREVPQYRWGKGGKL